MTSPEKLIRDLPPIPSFVRFCIPEPQYREMAAWINIEDAKALEAQRRSLDPSGLSFAGEGKSYAGAIGGAVGYQFTPGADDVELKVQHDLTHATLTLRFVNRDSPTSPCCGNRTFDTRDASSGSRLERFIEEQRALFAQSGRGMPEGPELSFDFGPTSIGTALKVTYVPTGEVKDLTDYDLW